MVQALLAEMATLTGVPTHHHSKKITKSRTKMVKPILKKVIPQSPKNSLDLDRGWDDQTADFGCGGIYESARTSLSRSARDASFQVTPTWETTGYGRGGATSGCASGTATPVGAIETTAPAPRSISINHRGRFQHARSTSGNSITTTGSSHRHGGSFVHPFQQTPRTTTPPITYANSFTSFERENLPRDYSPTVITENEDDELDLPGSTSLPRSTPSTHLHRSQPSNSHSTSSLRRPSLASLEQTSSLTDLSNDVNVVSKPPVRVNTLPISRSHPPQTKRPAHDPLNRSTSCSRSDLHLNLNNSADSPRPSLTLNSPTTPVGPMSPIRTSLEGAFRIRSRSEIDTGARREDIREARRKFEENERVKQEKYELEQRRKRERKDSKMDKSGRPSFTRKRTPPSSSNPRTASRLANPVEVVTPVTISEKGQDRAAGPGFMSSNYESTEGGAVPSFSPDVTDVRFETPKRANGAKRKTQSYWTSFMLWLRTRLLKLGRR